MEPATASVANIDWLLVLMWTQGVNLIFAAMEPTAASVANIDWLLVLMWTQGANIWFLLQWSQLQPQLQTLIGYWCWCGLKEAIFDICGGGGLARVPQSAVLNRRRWTRKGPEGSSVVDHWKQAASADITLAIRYSSTTSWGSRTGEELLLLHWRLSN